MLVLIILRSQAEIHFPIQLKRSAESICLKNTERNLPKLSLAADQAFLSTNQTKLSVYLFAQSSSFKDNAK